jgi:phage terminase small subunit
MKMNRTAKEAHPPPPKSRWPLSPRAREIWRETVGLVPGYIPLFEDVLALYCDERAALEKFDADLASERLDPRLARQLQRHRRKMLRLVQSLAADLCLSPGSRTELN